MSREIVITTSFQPHHEWLEIAQTHLDEGDSVTIIACEAEMLACAGNLSGLSEQCHRCINMRNKAIALLKGPIRCISYLQWLTDVDRKEIRNLPTAFSTPQQLRSFAVAEFDVGMAITSSLITLRGCARTQEILEKTAQKPTSRTASYLKLGNRAGKVDELRV